MIKQLTPIIAIAAILVLTMFAIAKGINGVAVAAGVAVIAGIGGYLAPHYHPPQSDAEKKKRSVRH